MTIYDWIPLKKMDGVLVSEWEGPQLETAGFLKMDVLGISQLEKFEQITKLIKQNHGKDISFDDMDLEEPGVYALFQEGLNEDVFQFGAMGLKGYCKELKPQNIEDLIATVALYRPGPMESGAHKKYIKIKKNEITPEYDYMLESVTKNTHSLYIYQEQVMKAVHILGGLTLVEAEDVRKAIGKSDIVKMQKYRLQFIQGAIKNGCSELNAIAVWNKLEAFGSYGYNRSHAAAYALIAYFSQWLKYTYPIEFWSVSLYYSKQEEISNRIAEMNTISNVRVLPPDINNSEAAFKPDFQKEIIYWSISSIKQIGEKTLEYLLEERKNNGEYFSFEEFYNRIKGKGVNKAAIRNLILSGCFDQLENTKNPSDRLQTMQKFNNFTNDDMPEQMRDPSMLVKDYFWVLKQKELTGFGYFDFGAIYKANKHKVGKHNYMDPISILSPESIGKEVCIIGVLSNCMERTVRKTGDKFAQVQLLSNDNTIDCVVWAQIWPQHRTKIMGGENKIFMVTGKIREPNDFQPMNHIQTNNNSIIEVL